MVIAMVLVIGAVGAFVMLSGGKDKDDGAKPVPENHLPTNVDPRPSGPKTPEYPKIGNEAFPVRFRKS